MLLSLLEMQLRRRVWTEQLLKRLSIVILDVLRVPRRREIKIKYKVWDNKSGQQKQNSHVPVSVSEKP